jgi:molybdopterin converting factor small subunit
MKVSIPTPLRSYTRQQAEVEAEGSTLDALLRDLDCRYPGIRFRMVNEQDALRAHIKLFINRKRALRLDTALGEGDCVQILQALSGG